MSEKNKWVLVTGAAKRIGRVIALDLAQNGWNIIVHYNNSQDEAAKTARDIEALGRKACLAEIDLADLSNVAKLIPTLANELGSITALINNAAMFMPDGTVADDLHNKTNFEAPRILSEAFYEKSKKGGVIINILDADPTGSDFTHYNASKIGLQRITVEMATRFAPKVRVNGVALGPVLRNPRESAEHFNSLVKNAPLGISASPENAAETVRFLIDAKFITGTIIPADGGVHLESESKCEGKLA